MALTPDEALKAAPINVAGQFLAISSFPTGKASVAVLLMRLFPGKTLRWVLWAFVVANAVFFYTDAIFIVAQCTPVAYQWNRTIPGGTCWDPQVVIIWGYITGGMLLLQ